MAVGQLVVNNHAAFARHETFHPRYGWLLKAVTGTAKDPELFTRPDATVELGVGKNMVEAIRYWGQAFKLVSEAPNPKRPRLPWLVPSELGRAMFSEGGWDPYLEAPGTLWVLHWWLLSPKTKAPVWWLAFNSFNAIQFTEAALTRFVLNAIEQTSGWTGVIESSVKKDVDCLVRMYSHRKAESRTDDLIDCPFRELGLVEPVAGESRTYRFVIGPKAGVPDQVVAYVALDFMTRVESASTISIARLAQDVGSPGRVFKMTEAAIFESLTRFAATDSRVRLAEPAGLKQLLVSRDAGQDLASVILQEYYRRETGSRYKFPHRNPAIVGSGVHTPKLKAQSVGKVTADLARRLKTDKNPTIQRKLERMVRRVEAQIKS